jgi:hypothetical protein
MKNPVSEMKNPVYEQIQARKVKTRLRVPQHAQRGISLD